MIKSFTLFGIKFINGDYNQAINYLMQSKFMVVPAAPALATIKTNKIYYDALLGSDFAIPDSGFMVLTLKIFKGIKISKLSGVEFIRSFIEDERINGNIFLIDPNEISRNINNKYLRDNGFTLNIDDHYIAPYYNKYNICDFDLLKILEEKKPKFIMINLGGGIQEPLGLFIKKNLSYNPAILCTGAALAILNGQQASVPKWVDKLYMGWLARCMYEPKIFIPRYIYGVNLFLMLIREKIIINEENI